LVKVRKDKNNIYTKLLKDKKGISPVITTVILVAVGIALAVAIGLWMSGLVATFTRFEKLEVTSAYATGGGAKGWNVTITVKNTGSADATITMVMINGVPTTSVTGINWTKPSNTDPANGSVPISVGEIKTFQFNLDYNATIGNGKASSGITLNIVLHSAAGKDYPASVTLP
jgi:flagellin-like protein